MIGNIRKFRAWDKEKKEMVHDVSVGSRGITVTLQENPLGTVTKSYEEMYPMIQIAYVDESIGEVYEGDIVLLEYEWEGKLEYTIGNIDSIETFDEMWAGSACIMKKVIGNVFENEDLKELSKSEKPLTQEQYEELTNISKS